MAAFGLDYKNTIPVLVIRADLRGYIRVREDGYITTRLGGNSCALDILVAAEADIDRRVAHCLQELRSGVFVKHTLTEGAELLPFIATVL